MPEFRTEIHKDKTKQEALKIMEDARGKPGFAQANLLPEPDREFTVVLIFNDG